VCSIIPSPWWKIASTVMISIATEAFATDSDAAVYLCSLLKLGTVVLGLCPRKWLKLIVQHLLRIFRSNSNVHCLDFVYNQVPSTGFSGNSYLYGLSKLMCLYTISDLEMWPSSDEQGDGCAPWGAWIHQGDAVPVLTSLSTKIRPRGLRYPSVMETVFEPFW
jgi:hypothetical protein